MISLDCGVPTIHLNLRVSCRFVNTVTGMLFMITVTVGLLELYASLWAILEQEVMDWISLHS